MSQSKKRKDWNLTWVYLESKVVSSCSPKMHFIWKKWWFLLNFLKTLFFRKDIISRLDFFKSLSCHINIFKTFCKGDPSHQTPLYLSQALFLCILAKTRFLQKHKNSIFIKNSISKVKNSILGHKLALKTPQILPFSGKSCL